MAQYRVSWEIDIEAGMPEQAARQALEIQRDPESTATQFKVRMVGPCPRCKQHYVHKPGCALLSRISPNESLLQRNKYVDYTFKVDLLLEDAPDAT